MTSYTTLEVENFKGIRKMKLEGLGMVNVFVGGNNVGKTSVLQALYCSHKIQDTKLESDGYLSSRFMEEFALSGEKQSIENIFFNQKLLNKISIVLNDEKTSIYFDDLEVNPLLDQSRLYKRLFEDSSERINGVGILQKNDEKTLLFVESEDAYSDYNYRRRREMMNPRFGRNRPFSYVSDFIKTNADFNLLSTDLYEAEKEDYYTEILKPLEKKLSKIRFTPNGVACYLVDVEKSFSLSLMGDGFVKKLALACLIAKNRRNILLIDEIENGFHYSVQEDMWRMILTAAKEDGTQFFFTTHSYEVLESLNAMTQKIITEWEQEKAEGYQDGKLLVGENKTPMEPVCVFELEKSTDDVVTYKRFAGKSLNGAIKRHMELRGKGANAHG